METTYRWTDYFSKQRLSCRCEVIGRGRTGTTATIRLKGYGPKGRPPGTIMTVRMSSIGMKPERQSYQIEIPDWHQWTD